MRPQEQHLRDRYFSLMKRYVKVAALLPMPETIDCAELAAAELAELKLVLKELTKIKSAMDEIVEQARCSH